MSHRLRRHTFFFSFLSADKHRSEVRGTERGVRNCDVPAFSCFASPPAFNDGSQKFCLHLSFFFFTPRGQFRRPCFNWNCFLAQFFPPYFFSSVFRTFNFFLFFFLRCSLFVPLCCWPDELRAMHEGGTWDAGERQHRKKKCCVRKFWWWVEFVPCYRWGGHCLDGVQANGVVTPRRKIEFPEASLHSGVEGKKMDQSLEQISVMFCITITKIQKKEEDWINIPNICAQHAIRAISFFRMRNEEWFLRSLLTNSKRKNNFSE